MSQLGLEPTRIAAVDAKTVSDEELKQRLALDKPFQSLRRGSEANILSHCKAWETLLDSSHPAALVAEDDALFAVDLTSVLGAVDWWPDGAGLLKLEAYGAKLRHLGTERGRTPNGRRLFPIARFPGGTGGYLINRDCAEAALSMCVNVDISIDRFLFDVIRSPAARRLKPLQVVPTMIRQRHEDFASDIQITERAARPGATAYLGGTMCRRMGIASRQLALTMNWATRRVRRVRVEFAEEFPS